MTVNERIRKIRLVLNMRQTEFSKAICVSNGYTAGIENGYRIANDRIIRLICLTFGVSERWLKTGEGEIFNNSPTENDDLDKNNSEKIEQLNTNIAALNINYSEILSELKNLKYYVEHSIRSNDFNNNPAHLRKEVL